MLAKTKNKNKNSEQTASPMSIQSGEGWQYTEGGEEARRVGEEARRVGEEVRRVGEETLYEDLQFRES